MIGLASSQSDGQRQMDKPCLSGRRKSRLMACALVCSALLLASGCTRLGGPPTGVVAVPLSSTEILLKWAPLPGEFEIMRKEGVNGKYLLVGRTGKRATTHLNAGLKPRTTYYFQVRACDKTGCSGYSQEVSAETR